MVLAIFVAAGISSRFGGRIKALAKVGKNNETLLELSMRQAINAGVNKFIIVVSKQTYEPIKNHFKNNFKNIPIFYRFQETPNWRVKPLGHGHAFLSAKEDVTGPTILASTDDIFGQQTWNSIVTKVKKTQCIPGYLMSKVLPAFGKVNRGMMLHQDNKLLDIEEQLGIESSDIPSKYTGQEYAAMMMYGVHPEFFVFLQAKVDKFIKDQEPKKEIITGNVINNFIKQFPGSFYIVPTEDKPLSLTFPEDEESILSTLKQKF